MEKSFGLLFYLKTPKKYDKGDKTIYLRLTVNGMTVDVSTRQKCDPLKWNVSAGRAEGKMEQAKSLNAYLEVLQRKVYEARMYLVENDFPVTAENIKTVLTDGALQQKKYMLMEIFQRHNEQMAELVGKEYAPGTLERYITSFKHTQAFLQWKYKVNDLNIAQLNFEFIAEY